MNSDHKQKSRSVWPRFPSLQVMWCQLSAISRGCLFISTSCVGLSRLIRAYHVTPSRGGSNGPGGAAPSKKFSPPVSPMKFMIKHNLPLVRGGSLWQYRSVPPSCNYGHPTGPQNVNPRTATDAIMSREGRKLLEDLQWSNRSFTCRASVKV